MPDNRVTYPPAQPAQVARRIISRLRSRAAWITLAYALFATLWIVFTDRALEWLVSDPEMAARVAIYKGLAFVTATAALLLFLMRRAFGTMELGYSFLRSQQAEIERLRRLYSSLGHINQAIVRLHDRDGLFQRVCEVLVEEGGFTLAWIGWNDAATSRLVPLAVAGDEDDFIRNTEIHSDERPTGLGPSGRAFRSNHAILANDVLDDASTAPWRAEIERRALRSAAAFPIRLDGAVAGVLTVCSATPDFFQGQEVALLEEVVVDLSFALDNLSREAERHRAEMKARSETVFSQTMIDSMPGVVYFYDMQGRFLRWNRNFEAVSGYSAEEIAGMHPLDFFAPADRSLLAARIGEVFDSGESWVEAPFRTKTGDPIPHFFTGRRVEFEGRSCLVGVGIDVTDRRRAEDALRASEHRYRTTLDSILEGCQLVGYDWRYLYLNDAAALHNRRPNAELLGRTVREAWPGIEATRVHALLERCMTERTPVQEEVNFAFADGTEGWFELRVQPVEEGILLLSVETTERKRAELALHELNLTLEHQVTERTAELKTALERAEAADRIKSAFLATMSHELRTPLNSIIGFTGIVLQGRAGPLTAEQTKQLGMVRGSARHLLDLINDVLDISKIEAGQLELKGAPFDLAAAIERVMGSVKPLAERKGLSLHAALPPRLPEMISDRRRVEQVLLNLLNNALKFTDQGGVTLTVDVLAVAGGGAQDERDRAVRLRVSDTGIGIREDDLAILFQPFRQIDSGITRQHDGTGLGLAICRRLVELLGGTISATSEWQRGSEFTVVLPPRLPAEQRVGSPAP